MVWLTYRFTNLARYWSLKILRTRASQQPTTFRGDYVVYKSIIAPNWKMESTEKTVDFRAEDRLSEQMARLHEADGRT